MNLLHLKYVIEVAKAGSISKAASNLYMNQPHLSKTIKDLEENMQIIIFERTSKGVIPTKKGAEFIERAKSIIMQVEEMEAMYQGYDDKSVHLDICVPRASYVANAFTNYLSMINFHDKNIKVNYEKLEELIDYHCNNGTDSIVICGTTGESATMTEEEHLDCIKKTIDFTKGRVPVIAGTGSNCTRTAIELSKAAAEYGADGLLVVTPYYNKATQAGLIQHYTAVANEAKAPIIMYSVASRTGCNIEPATVAHLVKNVDNIVGIKEASGNISQVAKIMNLTDGKVDLYSGNDDQIVPIMSLGGKGVISVLSNIAPKETHDICAKFFEGDVKGSMELQLNALPLIEQLFCEVNPIPVKKAMNLMGMEVGGLRMPLTELTEAHTETLKKAMKDFGIL